MRYDLDTFVNSNNYNREVSAIARDDEELFEVFPVKFATDNNIKHNFVNQTADPVFVYELNGAPVAWYDCENQVGFVVQ